MWWEGEPPMPHHPKQPPTKALAMSTKLWVAAFIITMAIAHPAWCQSPDAKPDAPTAPPTPPAQSSTPPPAAAAPAPEIKTPPKGEVIFFQMLTPGFLVGTGFFIKTPKGEIIGATSIHFLDLDEGPLESIAWLGGSKLEEIASSDKAFGQPGVQPKDLRDPDYRKDYLLLTLKAPPKNAAALEIDHRLVPRARAGQERGELVWFPVMDGKAKPDGVHWINGEVHAASGKVITIVLDESIELNGSSGTPVVSQETGKVIGVVSAGSKGFKKPTVYLAPARAIWKAMTKAEVSGERPTLKTIDWTKHGEVKPKPKKPPEPKQPEKPTSTDPDDE